MERVCIKKRKLKVSITVRGMWNYVNASAVLYHCYFSFFFLNKKVHF
jgi:hypothetical protein